ncbi:MAG: hypothetical protein ACRDBY_01265 [Cetobacterium sp.]
MDNNKCIKTLITEYLGETALIEELELIFPLKKQTLYKRLQKLPKSISVHSNGYKVVFVKDFLNLFLLSEEEKGW